jgi:hypothetical protein
LRNSPLPIVAAIGCASASSAFAGATFVALAVGVLVGALRIARAAEGPAHG